MSRRPAPRRSFRSSFAVAGLFALLFVGAVPAGGARSNAVGPRPLPPTFVRLELGAFPRPAAAACSDNRRLIRVRPPRGIAAAFASARPGTTVLASPGVYVESRGEPTAVDWRVRNVCLRAAGRGVVLQAAPGQKYGLSIAAGDSVVDGVTVRGFGSSIGLDAGRGRTLRRVTIENVRVERPAGSFRDGIVAYGDNRLTSGKPPAMDGLLVLDTTVSGADLGISCNAGPCAHWWVECTRVEARPGASESSGADAFAVEDGRQIVLVDSTFARASADGIDTKADDVVVFACRVLDVARNGIKLWRGGDVIDTVVDGSDADAALVGDRPGRYRYLHVLVRRHDPHGTAYVGTWGYDQRRAVRLEIVNSMFAGNSSGGFFAPAGSAISIRHSVFADRSAKLLELSDGRTFSVAQLRMLEGAGYGRGNVVGDPGLVLAGPLRWSTRAGSPARDLGERVAGLSRDLYGRPRVLGPAPDAGPVETA